MSKPALARFAFSTLILPSMLACSTTPLGASDADAARARSRAAQGAGVYERDCAACHGERGEGLAGSPPVMGNDALPAHPKDPLAPKEYWQVVTFLAVANGKSVPEAGVDDSSADSVRLAR